MPDNDQVVLYQLKILSEGDIAYDPAVTLSVFPVMITFIVNIVFFLLDHIALSRCHYVCPKQTRKL